MFIKKQFTVKEKLEIKYVFRRKIFHENILKETNFTSLFKQSVYQLSNIYIYIYMYMYMYMYIYISGSNNPKWEDHESNRAKK